MHTLEHYVDAGGIALGAFASGRLVGIGVVVPHLRPGIAQLAYLHVERAIACEGCRPPPVRASSTRSPAPPATPRWSSRRRRSENTVRFYLGRGFQPMAEPLAELFELEPEDVHMSKVL